MTAQTTQADPTGADLSRPLSGPGLGPWGAVHVDLNRPANTRSGTGHWRPVPLGSDGQDWIACRPGRSPVDMLKPVKPPSTTAIAPTTHEVHEAPVRSV